MEAWMPGLNRYGEISSASNCTDYQVVYLPTSYCLQWIQSELGGYGFLPLCVVSASLESWLQQAKNMLLFSSAK
eukprot:scaffold269853_cov21-Tisochrysis_lutea.AAC.2